RHEDKFLLSPIDASAYQIRDFTTGSLVISNGFGLIFGPTNNNSSKRDAYQLNGTFYAANHEIKVGGDYENNRTFTTSYYTGGSSSSLARRPATSSAPRTRRSRTAGRSTTATTSSRATWTIRLRASCREATWRTPRASATAPSCRTNGPSSRL